MHISILADVRRWLSEPAPAGASEELALEPERRFLLVVFLVACLLIFLRRPDALTNPQFFAEDGTIWYADAHDLGGLRALFLPSHRGYFHTVERLAGLAAQAVPMLWAPLVFNIIAITIEALPAVLLASRRFAPAVPPRWTRMLLAFLYLALPTTWTTISNLSHSPWHLAVLASLVVVAAPGNDRWWRGFDVAVVALSGLTGPTCLLLTPVATLAWGLRRTRWSLVLLLVTAGAATIQGISLMLWGAPLASHPPLGASAFALAELFARRIVYGALIGQQLSASLFASNASVWASVGVQMALALCGGAALVYALLRAPIELRLLIVFCALVLLAALFWPIPLSGDWKYWETLMAPGAHSRYFLPLTFALIATFIWMLGRKPMLARAGGAIAMLFTLTLAVPFDWREPEYRDYHFSAYVQRYDRALPGATVQIPIPPGWGMILHKK
jgi:hypothetical protein